MNNYLRGSLVGLTLSLIACGGSAFSSGSTSDASSSSDALDDALEESDAAKSDAAPDAVGQHDAPQEANSADSSTPGDSSSPDAASDACTEYNHNDGFGIYFPDCTKCGYNSASLALSACQLYAATKNISATCQPVGCGGYGLMVSATACYTWVYQGGTAGYVELAFSGGCLCNSAGGAMTYGQCQ